MKVSEAFTTEAALAAVTAERRYLHMVAVRDNLTSILWIKKGIVTGDLPSAVEAWDELDSDTQIALWLSPRDGGVFTTAERKAMHSDEFNEARQ